MRQIVLPKHSSVSQSMVYLNRRVTSEDHGPVEMDIMQHTRGNNECLFGALGERV